MCLTEYISELPWELKYNILLHLPFESVSFIECDYFWFLYCKKNNVIKNNSLPFISWKETYMKYDEIKWIRRIEYRLFLLKL